MQAGTPVIEANVSFRSVWNPAPLERKNNEYIFLDFLK